MLPKLISLALCASLAGQAFAAELPTAGLTPEGGSPVRPVVLPVLPDVNAVPGTVTAVSGPNVTLSIPVQLSLPLPGVSASASARSAAPTALAAAQTAAAAATTPQAHENVAVAREAGVATFDAQRPGESSAGEPVLGAESRTQTSLQPATPRVPGYWWKQWVPHAITGLNLAGGVASMAFAAHGAYLAAGTAIVAAAVFDAFDGMAARKLGVAGPMGTMMDSQADGVSFGAAPALLVYLAALRPLAHGGPALLAVGFAAAAFSAFGAAYRLSRYNLDALAAGADKKPSAYFKGLPSPGGAIALIALTFAAPASGTPFTLAALGSVAVGALMMSRLPYLKVTTSKRALLGSAAVALAVGGPLALLGHALLAPAAVVGVYLLSGPLLALHRGGSPAWKHELRRKAFHQSNLLFLGGFLAGWSVMGRKIVAAFAALTAGLGFVEYCRLYGFRLRRFLERSSLLKKGFDFLERVKRDKENHQPSGVFFGTLGATIAAAVAVWMGDWRYMAGAILALTFGDAASPLVGMRFGWKRYRVDGTLRSADGTLAGFAVALAIGLALGFPAAVALGAAVVFSLIDTYPVKPDDNLWIPALYPVALALFGWLGAAYGLPAVLAATAFIGGAGALAILRKSSKP